jgi:hypothetical protein
MRDVLDEALVDLAPRQREVFHLRELSGVPAAEVCERLGISAGNERLLLHRARTQLRNRLYAYFGRLRRTPARESDADSAFGLGWIVARGYRGASILEDLAREGFQRCRPAIPA